MNNLLLIFALAVNSSPALASSKKALYQQSIPQSYCMDPNQLLKRIKHCNDNVLLYQAAERCVKDFQSLRKKVALELKARMSAAASSQDSNFQANQADTAEAAAAHSYLIKIGDKAVSELDDYFDFFEHPDDAENDEEILAEPCFIKPADALDNLVNDLEEEVENMREAKATELILSTTSGARKANLDTLTDAPVSSGAAGKSAPSTGPKGKDQRKSDISGTEEKKKNP
jgi:hypothetical protein